MQIDPSQLSSGRRYFLMISCIIPRPIAWVSTVNEGGGYNLAPYSFFNGFSATPPLIGIGFSSHDEKVDKDTLRNIRRTGELTVNLGLAEHLEDIVASSQDTPYGTDEFERLGLRSVPGESVSSPRVDGIPVALECVSWELKALGDGGSHLLLAEIRRFHIQDTLLNEWGTVDSHRFKPVSRLGGISYARMGEIIDMSAGGG